VVKVSRFVLMLLFTPLVLGVFSATPLEFYKVGVTPNVGTAITQASIYEEFSVKTIVTSGVYDTITPIFNLPPECTFTPPFSSMLLGGQYIGNPKEVRAGNTVFYFTGIRCQQIFIFDSDFKTFKMNLISFGQNVETKGTIKVSNAQPVAIAAPAPPAEMENPIAGFYFTTNLGKKANSIVVETGKAFSLRADGAMGLAYQFKVIGDGCHARRTAYAAYLALWSVSCSKPGTYSLMAAYYEKGLAYYSAPFTVTVVPKKTKPLTCEIAGLGC